MRAQRDVVVARNQSLVGSEVEVLVDGRDSHGNGVGRTRADAPEIDCGVRIVGKAEACQIFDAKVLGIESDGYDLVVKPVRRPPRSNRGNQQNERVAC